MPNKGGSYTHIFPPRCAQPGRSLPPSPLHSHGQSVNAARRKARMAGVRHHWLLAKKLSPSLTTVDFTGWFTAYGDHCFAAADKASTAPNRAAAPPQSVPPHRKRAHGHSQSFSITETARALPCMPCMPCLPCLRQQLRWLISLRRQQRQAGNYTAALRLSAAIWALCTAQQAQKPKVRS